MSSELLREIRRENSLPTRDFPEEQVLSLFQVAGAIKELHDVAEFLREAGNQVHEILPHEKPDGRIVIGIEWGIQGDVDPNGHRIRKSKKVEISGFPDRDLVIVMGKRYKGVKNPFWDRERLPNLIQEAADHPREVVVFESQLGDDL